MKFFKNIKQIKNYSQFQNKESGAVMMTSVLFFIIISVLIVAGLTGPSAREYKMATDAISSRQSYYLAESESEDVYYRLKNNQHVSQTQSLVLGNSSATTYLNFLGSGNVDINSIGNVYNKERVVDMKISGQNRVITSFGAQIGTGGLNILSTGSVINGDVYSLGPIVGVTDSNINGSASSASYPSLFNDQSNDLGTPYDISFGNNTTSKDVTQSFKVDQTIPINKISLYLKRVGTPSDATVSIINKDFTTSLPGQIVIATGTISSSSINTGYSWYDVVFSQQQMLSVGQTYWIVISPSVSSSNYYIIGASSGDTYTNGVGKIGQYGSSWTDPISGGGDYFFRLYQGGLTGSITRDIGSLSGYFNVGNTISTSTIVAHTIDNISSAGTIYCSSGTGNSSSCSPHNDPDMIGYSITDSMIDGWKSDIVSTGSTYLGNLTISSYFGSTTSMSMKVQGDLTINANLTMSGNIWVTGNLTIGSNKNVNLASLYGSNSGVIIVDGKISMNTSHLNGTGTGGSRVVLISNNNSISTSSPAINITSSDSSLSKKPIVYAPYGLIQFGAGNSSFTQASAYKLSLNISANITYDPLISALTILSGTSTTPGYNISSWAEAQ